MLMIRKITKDDQMIFQQFCRKFGTEEILQDATLYFGVFDNLGLQGYTKVELNSFPKPFLSDIQITDTLESPIVEGLLRGTFNYCYIHHDKNIIVSKINWLEDYLVEALEIIEKNVYNQTAFYDLNLEKLFNKPCKGRSMCQ